MTAREKWRGLVRRWKESGLTCDGFAAQAGINAGTLSYWKWRLGKEATPAKRSPRRAEAPVFVEVTPTAGWTPRTSERIELVVNDDIVVRVPEHFDDESLRRVLGVLRKSGGKS
jgi:hypothetical protein